MKLGFSLMGIQNVIHIFWQTFSVLLRRIWYRIDYSFIFIKICRKGIESIVKESNIGIFFEIFVVRVHGVLDWFGFLVLVKVGFHFLSRQSLYLTRDTSQNQAKRKLFLPVNLILWIHLAGLFGLTSGQRVPRVSIVPSERSVAKLEGENYLVSCKSNDNMPTQWQNPRNEKVGTSELQ